MKWASAFRAQKLDRLIKYAQSRKTVVWVGVLNNVASSRAKEVALENITCRRHNLSIGAPPSVLEKNYYSVRPRGSCRH